LRVKMVRAKKKKFASGLKKKFLIKLNIFLYFKK